MRYSLTSPKSYVHSNLEGFVAILELLRRYADIAFIYASSSSIYGLNTKIPFSETDSSDRPASLYGATKKSNEMMAHAYHHLFGLRCTALRFFTVYGPWGRPDMAYFSFTKAVLEEKPIPVFGDGSLLRDFTYIDDIVQGTLSAIDLGASNEVFNLGNNEPKSVIALIEILEKLLGKKAILEFLPTPSIEIPITYADISKSERILGFHPKTSLQEGLEHFAEWYLREIFSSKEGLGKGNEYNGNAS